MIVTGRRVSVCFLKCQTVPLVIVHVFMVCCQATLLMALGHRKPVNLEHFEQTENIWLRNWSRNVRLVVWIEKRLCITLL